MANKQKIQGNNKKPPLKTSRIAKGKTADWGTVVIMTVIVLIYVIVPVATPIMEAFDANGPKFMTLAVANLLTYSFFLVRKSLHSRTDFTDFLVRNKFGLAYLLILMMAVLSFFNAINIFESVINFSKMFTIFSAAYILSVVFRSDKRFIKYITVAMSLLLITDSFTVFYRIYQYISGAIDSIYVIKSVYSNKNILAAAIFVKIPFALWLFTFQPRWARVLGFFSLFSALLATFFMSTRTFYLGMFSLMAIYLVYLLLVFLKKRESGKIATLITVLGAFLFILLFFEMTQRYVYPKENRDYYNVDVAGRLASIAVEKGGSRPVAWERTLWLIRDNPMLGVGIGNWKIQILQYENLTSTDYTYMYKNHNDFLEITSEIGIVGGLLFLSLFLMAGFDFIRAFFKPGATSKTYMYQFLPAFGLLAYSFDAFFNFPADRPEIGALFAVYIGISIANAGIIRIRGKAPEEQMTAVGQDQPEIEVKSTPLSAQVQSPPANSVNGYDLGTRNMVSAIFVGVMVMLMLAAVFVFVVNYKSISMQRIVKSEMVQGKLTTSAETVMNNLPFLPTVSLEGEPIAVHKARYLINEKKFDSAIVMLKNDRSSPYDTRQEFFIAMAYAQLGNMDSSIVYGMKVFRQKPMFYNNTSNLCQSLMNKGRPQEANKIIRQYLKAASSNRDAWLMASLIQLNMKREAGALALIDSALKILPGDTVLMKQRRALNLQMKVRPYESIYNKAMRYFSEGNYRMADQSLTEFISREPDLADAYDFRAFSRFFLNRYGESNADIEKAIALGGLKGNLINLRGVNHHTLGNDSLACLDFQLAISLGDKDGHTNINKFCQNQGKSPR